MQEEKENKSFPTDEEMEHSSFSIDKSDAPSNDSDEEEAVRQIEEEELCYSSFINDQCDSEACCLKCGEEKFLDYFTEPVYALEEEVVQSLVNCRGCGMCEELQDFLGVFNDGMEEKEESSGEYSIPSLSPDPY